MVVDQLNKKVAKIVVKVEQERYMSNHDIAKEASIQHQIGVTRSKKFKEKQKFDRGLLDRISIWKILQKRTKVKQSLMSTTDHGRWKVGN